MNLQWQTFYGSIQKWVAQRRQSQLIEAGDKHERYVSILQKRYGYTREKAVYELEKRYSKVRFFLKHSNNQKQRRRTWDAKV
ncbi:MAG: hypothetical protein KG029_08760 [Bacteroidetes bacterium]|nr:hypothetical protein [Bacteroidota bacterium]